MAKQVAVSRANDERPTSLESELKVEDQLHYEVYQVAGSRICTILQDKNHYMNGKLEPVQTSRPQRRQSGGAPTADAAPSSAGSAEMHNNGVKCNLCNKKIKACATFAEIAQKQDAACSGFAEKTMEQQMKELVDESSLLVEGQEGHRRYLG